MYIVVGVSCSWTFRILGMSRNSRLCLLVNGVYTPTTATKTPAAMYNRDPPGSHQIKVGHRMSVRSAGHQFGFTEMDEISHRIHVCYIW